MKRASTITGSALGNVTQRKDLRANQVENFTYDGLNRLESAAVKVGAAPTVMVLNLSYDALGNICSKNGATYTYAGRDGCNSTGTAAAASPHAVTQIGAQGFTYDATGALWRPPRPATARRRAGLATMACSSCAWQSSVRSSIPARDWT